MSVASLRKGGMLCSVEERFSLPSCCSHRSLQSRAAGDEVRMDSLNLRTQSARLGPRFDRGNYPMFLRLYLALGQDNLDLLASCNALPSYVAYQGALPNRR